MDVLLANPRGFCAGVERAIAIVERALEQYGAPIYVRHEVVHNKFVVDSLRAKGAIFIDDLELVPEGATLIFSAHGVPQAVRHDASSRGLRVFDATCPLVTKVHVEVAKMREAGREIVMIGHKGHPEVEGTMGQTEGGMYLVETTDDVIGPRRKRSGQAGLCHADHAVGGRRRSDRQGAAQPLPGHRRSEARRHLLRHAEPSGRR
jgi:4-hydroxy-3-methylbut-2-enyl diphosphate reductase